MTRGRPASQPAEGHRRPRVLTSLLVLHVNEKGDGQREYDFGTLPLPPGLQEQLADLFANCVKPTGAWRNLPSGRQGWTAIGTFARWMAEQDPVPESIGDINAALWLRFRVSRPDTVGGRRALRVSARLLRDHPDLPATTAKEMRRRVARDEAVEDSYNDTELRELEAAAKRVFRDAEKRILTNLRHLDRFRAGEFEGGSQDHLLGELLEHLAQTGDVPHLHASSGSRFLAKAHQEALGGGSREFTWKRLFLDAAEVAAVAVLIAAQEGWNQTSILELDTPAEVSGNLEQPVYRIELEKRRRRPPHRYETRNLTDGGPGSTGRLIRRVLVVTEPARAQSVMRSEPTPKFLSYHVTDKLCEVDGRSCTAIPGGLISDTVCAEVLINAFTQRAGQRVNFRRLRKAVNARHLRQPNQNKRDTHDSVYVLTDPHTYAENEDLIARGLERAVEHASKVEALVRDHDSEDVDDTVTAGCTDTLQSPFSPWGVPCEASFLLCLACSNAVVMPRHLPRLAYLYECLVVIRGSIAPERWERIWAANFARLHSLRTEHYSESQWVQALDQVADVDRALVDQLLRGEFDI